MDYSSMPPFQAFISIIFNFFKSIIDMLSGAVIVFDESGSYTTVADILFAAIVIGFVVSLFWKGARAE